MNRRANIFAALIVIAVMIAAASCSDMETYSEIPKVEFQKVFLADTTDKELGNKVKLQEITLQITDGDGNLGLNRDGSDTTKYNLFITMFKKEQGQYVPAIDTIFKYRIPYKQPIGQNKYLRAEVIVSHTTPTIYIEYDTIRYEIYVMDRNGNNSNTAVTCDIPIRMNGTVFADGSNDFELYNASTRGDN
ncbi:MAG: hypothetical protein J5595_09785 [Bacteroidales bacterium]|nr:hypothetical protein [Bacteroidales bacterium]